MKAGRLVISLDFELMWGVRDHMSVADYGDAVLGARQAIPRMLRLFEKHSVKATWATVGLLFAKNREEMLENAPPVLPDYENSKHSPYAFIEDGLGADEQADPWHFGRTLVDRIADTEGQEIATHSYSHFCCLEPGHSLEAFDADLAAARSIAHNAGHVIQSIVFARNQFSDEHIGIARQNGIRAYRGSPPGAAYKSKPRRADSLLLRGIRLVDSLVPVGGEKAYEAVTSTAGCLNVKASRFLRPYHERYPAFSDWHLRMIKGEMSAAARAGTTYHLWWHPHNMGRCQEANLAQLEKVLVIFADLRDRFEFKSVNMGSFVET